MTQFISLNQNIQTDFEPIKVFIVDDEYNDEFMFTIINTYLPIPKHLGCDRKEFASKYIYIEGLGAYYFNTEWIHGVSGIFEIIRQTEDEIHVIPKGADGLIIDPDPAPLYDIISAYI